MMNCGYDPAPGGTYDLPPIAPQMWHAYHVAGEQLSMAILAALIFRFRTGLGQHVSCAVHEAVAKCTEVDLMSWVMRRAPVLRQTCRHARESISPHPTATKAAGNPQENRNNGIVRTTADTGAFSGNGAAPPPVPGFDSFPQGVQRHDMNAILIASRHPLDSV